MSPNYFDQIAEAAAFIRQQSLIKPETGIILGTGLGRLAERVEGHTVIEYADIPHFPTSTVESHKGRLVFGTIDGREVMVMHGRFHYYEGYSMQQVVFPVYVMKMLGAKNLLVSNAAGSINPAMPAGSLMLIQDHINLQPENPLRGKNDGRLGPRFPDMSQPYNRELGRKLLYLAEKHNITLHKGVYVSVQGPNLETTAEYKFLRMIGADVVGMSTVPEVIAAAHCGLKVCAVSVITDEAFHPILEPVTLEQILAKAAVAEPGLNTLFEELVKEL